MAGDITTCPYCGVTDGHAPERCHMVRAITYRKDGTIKRVELGPRYWVWPMQLQQQPQQPNWFAPIGPSPSAPTPRYPASPNIPLGPQVSPASATPRPWESPR